MGVQRGGLLGGGDRELQHRLPISGRLGVVRQPRQVALRFRRFAQRRQDAGVEEPAAERRDGRQDGLASQLMAEGQPVAGSPQQATGDALVGFVEDRTGDGQQEVRVDRRADHGRDVEDRPRLGREARRAGQHGITDRGRHGLALGGQHLGQKERVAPGQPVQGGGVSAAARCQSLHSLFRQRADADAMDGWRCRQIAEDQTEGVIGPDLIVTVGDDEEDRQIPNPPPEEAQQLERGAVGPVGVFADDDRRPRPRGEGREHLPEEPITRVAVEGLLVDEEAERGRQVAHGTERTRRGERVARGPQHRRGCRDPAAERVDQRGLANPGLAADEHHAPCPAAAWRSCSAR